jgi:mono/diheme cytochrome c family protein
MVRISASLMIAASLPLAAASTATFNKDVLRILQKNCQTCHRPAAAIGSWADNGAPEGDKKDAPAPISFPSGWQDIRSAHPPDLPLSCI